MKATFYENVSNARNYHGEKETTSKLSLVCRHETGRLFVPVAVCFYIGRSSNSSTVYCSLWVNVGKIHTSGSGRAGGWGYHKESAAFADAVKSANITLLGSPYKLKNEEEDITKEALIGGCGHDSIEEAMKAIAIAAGVDVSDSIIV